MAAGMKIVISVVSLVLVVGTVIGLIAAVGRTHNGDNSSAMWTPAKTVTCMCNTTPYTDTCTRTLSVAAGKNETAGPKDYLRAVIEALLEELNKGLQVTLSVKKSIEESKTVGSMDEQSIKNCETNLKYALEDLDELIMKTLNKMSLEDFGKNAYDLRVWLTTIDVYQDTCLDNIKDPEQRKTVESGLHNSTELTRIAVDIVYGFDDILKALNIPISPNDKPTPSNARRLLQQMEVDQDGYPTWLHHNDRRLLAAPGESPPNAVVAKDGSGFKTIKEALAIYPIHHKGRFAIYVKEGIYDEIVTVERNMKNVFMYGDGRGRTIITGRVNGSSSASTFTVKAIGFLAKSMTFSNSIGPEGNQGVALLIAGDHSAVFDCSLEAHQDTLHYEMNRQFYKNCSIYGTIDFIFGQGVCLIQDSDIIVRRPLNGQHNVVTADGRLYDNETTVLVLQNCRIMADPYMSAVQHKTTTYLGRPWKAYARTVIMESEIGNLISRKGYEDWNDTVMHNLTATYLEYANHGPGADTAERVKWPHVRVIDRNEALEFTAGRILDSNYNTTEGPWEGQWLQRMLRHRFIPYYTEFVRT